MCAATPDWTTRPYPPPRGIHKPRPQGLGVPKLENNVSDKKKSSGAFAVAQRLGRSLMLPIATLPAAALLNRLGQADMLGADGLAQHLAWMQPVADVMAAAGGAVFSNLPLIFAVGVAVGFAKKADGSTGVAALFGYLVYQGVIWVMAPVIMGKPGPLDPKQLECLHGLDANTDKIAQVGPWNQGVKVCDLATQTPINYGVLGGIIIGITAALLWRRFYRVKLPDWRTHPPPSPQNPLPLNFYISFLLFSRRFS